MKSSYLLPVYAVREAGKDTARVQLAAQLVILPQRLPVSLGDQALDVVKLRLVRSLGLLTYPKTNSIF